jgi:predicted amidohydrolase
MKIGFIQFSPIFGDKEANVQKIKELITDLGADIIVLPEMCTTGYMVADRKELKLLAESIDGNTVKSLSSIVKENDCCLIFGMPEIDGSKIFSSAVALGPDGALAKHQKSHLFLKETLLFDKGETKPTLFEWRSVKIGLGVCYDYMFPEYWRVLALKKADLFCNTANFVFDYGFKMMQARSIENGVFSITVNRTGEERGQKFCGGSEMIDNRGGVLFKANDSESAYVIEVNLKKSRNKKWNEYNNLFGDRRNDLYS